MVTTSVDISKKRYFTRHYVYLLVGLVMLMAVATLGFIRWQSYLFAKVETETYEYHLFTMLNCAKITEVAREMEYEHLAERLSRLEAAPLRERMAGDHAVSLFVVRDALVEMNEQQRRYNNPEFISVLANADHLLAGLMAEQKEVVAHGALVLDNLDGMLSQMLVVMDQLQRLHAIAYNEHRLSMPMQRRQGIQKIVLFFLAIGGLCFLLSGKILNRIKKAEDGLRSFYADLQDMVDERTAELLSSNASLQDEIAVREEFERQLELAKVEAETANRAKSDFLANMSHEIRTPMNAIIGMNRLALDAEPGPEIQQYLLVVEQSADSLLVLVNDILDFSKIEAGQLELAERPFHLTAFIDALLPNFTVSCLEKGNTITTDIQENIYSSLIGDDHRLRQIFINLIGNAMKFTETGQITIGVQTKEETDRDILLQFKVVDTGIGVSEELHERIFESFSQADNTISRSHGGTGLGLTICQKLSGLLGGEIWLESKVGQGSTFYFTARFKKGDPQLQPQVDDSRKNGTDSSLEFNQLNILLVEDNRFNRDLAKIVLEQKGHQVQSAVNGLEALEALSKTVFDLLLMDVQMPEMDGLEATSLIRLCEARRANEAPGGHLELLLRLQDKLDGCHIPIIAMTAHALAGDRERFIGSGMDDYVAKPFQPEELFRVFAGIAGRES